MLVLGSLTNQLTNSKAQLKVTYTTTIIGRRYIILSFSFHLLLFLFLSSSDNCAPLRVSLCQPTCCGSSAGEDRQPMPSMCSSQVILPTSQPTLYSESKSTRYSLYIEVIQVRAVSFLQPLICQGYHILFASTMNKSQTCHLQAFQIFLDKSQQDSSFRSFFPFFLYFSPSSICLTSTIRQQGIWE